VGCELAQAFTRLGSQVTLIERESRLLNGLDPEAGELLARRLTAEGVSVKLSTEAVSFGALEGGRRARLRGPEGESELFFDEVLVAAGRRPRVAGLEELGFEMNGGRLAVDENLRATFPRVFACGDLAGPYQLTHAASYQAQIACLNALFGRFRLLRADHRVMPQVVFTDPEIAQAGLSEREARERGIPHEVTRFALAHLDRAVAEGETGGFVKILTEPGRDRILGATLAGARAGDCLAEIVLAMRHGHGLKEVLATIHAYPTWAEANRLAAGAWRRAHSPAWALRALGRFFAWSR
jgi:pyruvate/2-oxoglutarate dehydrogenase complex dihydrolipoamide dehydrogenase (E3) component